MIVQRWIAVFLFALSFVLPSIHRVHAMDMASMDDASTMHDHAMDDCDKNVCEPVLPQDCLELCLQSVSLDRQVVFFAVGTAVVPPVLDEVFLFTDRDHRLYPYADFPHHLQHHFTTQKRE